MKDSPSMDTHYAPPESPKIDRLIERADELRSRIVALRPLREDIWETIQQKLRIDWTYDSNAIEGSTLTRDETAFFLREGLTVEGKPFKDFLDARNHAEAIDWLKDVVADQRPITEGLVKEINALLLAGLTHTEAMDQFGRRGKKPATPGRYKKQPNHVLQLDGKIHYYTEPLQVHGEMAALCQWIESNLDVLHPIVTGAVAHYNLVRIHPFDDGNGRGARILMNLILMKKGFPPAIIRNEERRNYLEALAKADRGDLGPIIELVARSAIRTEETILQDLEGYKESG